MRKILAFCKRETVLTAALLLAVLSSFFVGIDRAYLDYIDADVLLLLFSLMAVVRALSHLGLFDAAGRALCRIGGNVRRTALLLVLACFFFAMLVTNDVALITFVPLALLLLSGNACLYTVTLMSAAANLGSMATPIGNPQNIYLVSHYAIDGGTFFSAVLPVAGLSLLLVSLGTLILPKKPLSPAVHTGSDPEPMQGRRSIFTALVCAVLFVLCLLSVFRVLPKWVSALAVLIAFLFLDRRALREVDYALLFTFVCFFVFVGNLERIDAVRAFLIERIAGRELSAGVLLSQIISNVPAALMLSGFGANVRALLLGVNVGGLGTLVASLASLISFQIYRRSGNAKTGRYLLVFTLVNVVLLIPLYLLSAWMLGSLA